MRQDAHDVPFHRRPQLDRDQRTDLRLRLRDGEPERERRRLVRRTFLADQLVADLRPIAVCDDEPRGVEQGLERADGATKVR